MPGLSFQDLACGGMPTDLVENTVVRLSEATKYVSISTCGNNEDLFLSLIQTFSSLGSSCTPAVRAKLDRLGARLDADCAAIRERTPILKVAVMGTFGSFGEPRVMFHRYDGGSRRRVLR
jgi:hypothetical protein